MKKVVKEEKGQREEEEEEGLSFRYATYAPFKFLLPYISFFRRS